MSMYERLPDQQLTDKERENEETAWIEAEIERQLNELSLDDIEQDTCTTETETPVSDTNTDYTEISSNALEFNDGFLDTYTSIFSDRFKEAEDKINECDVYIKHETTKDESSNILESFVQQAAEQQDEDVEVIREKILAEIEKEKHDSDDSESESEEEVKRSSVETLEDTKEEMENEMSHDDQNEPKITLNPEDGVLVEFQEFTLLEHNMKKQLKELAEKQKQKEEHLKQENLAYMKKQESNSKLIEEGRIQRKKEIEETEKKLAQEHLVRQSQIEKETQGKMATFSTTMKQMEMEIKKLEENTKREMAEMNERKQEEDSLKSQQTHCAATAIQRIYKGFRVRKKYQQVLEGKRKERQKKIYEERIHQVEAERKQLEKEKREKELEQKRIVAEKKKREEEIKLAEERKRVEEEEARKEQEQLKAEKIRRENEAKLKLETEIRRQEDIRRAEAEKKLQEELEKEAERKRLLELERKVEEETKRQEQLDMENKLVQEKLERQQLERKAEEEKKRQEQLDMENKLEQKRLEEEMQRSLLEQQKKQEVVEQKPLQVQDSEVFVPLRDDIESKRLHWMNQCKPWSKIESLHKSKKIDNIRLPRRPASAKNLPPLSEKLIIQRGHAASLKQVTTVELHDLPGCSLTALSQCDQLQYLVMNNCNLEVVDSLHNCQQLKYLDLQNNKIELVNLVKQEDLVYLDLSHNCLTSIHGLDVCVHLKVLNVAHNKVKKLGGLSGCQELHTLLVSDNQLISSSGLKEVVTLQVLELSNNHLSGLDDLGDLVLLQELTACSNTIIKMPVLTNHLLLENLNLSDNNITTMADLEPMWLPMLHHLNLSDNGLEDTKGCRNLILLKILDLRSNQILDEEGLLHGLKDLHQLTDLYIEGNPVTEEVSLSDSLTKTITRLTFLDERDVRVMPQVVGSQHKVSTFEEGCLSYQNRIRELKENYHKAIRIQCNSSEKKLEKLFRIHEQYFVNSHQLAVDARYAHEYGEVMCQFKESKNSSLNGEDTEVNNDADENTCSYGNTGSGNLPVDIKRLENDRFKPNSGNDLEIKSSLQLVENEGAMAHHASTVIQALWRGYCIRRDIDLETIKWMAANKIQALWRGYRLRKRLNYALDYANVDDHELDFNLDEIDLSSFDVKEEDLDKAWLPPNTPQIPSNHVVLGTRPPSGKSSEERNAVAMVPHPPSYPKQAWRNSPSPAITALTDRSVTPQGRPPRPPSSTLSGGETHRSVLSKKEEQLSEEWGFKDARTAELMVQRAKKLKYNSERKKKLNKLDPRERLALFRKLEQSMGVKTVRPPHRKSPKKVEYFHAKEKEARNQRVGEIHEMKEKSVRTFEWLHSQVGPVEGHFDDDCTASYNLRQTAFHGSDTNLPRMTPEVLDGKRANLTASPVSLQSVSTIGSSASNHRRHSISESRPAKANIELPPIKTSSAPSERIKDRKVYTTTSWKDQQPKNLDPGWGGGRKRPAKM